MMSCYCLSKRGKSAQVGFTLIEMLVSLIIGLIVVLGATRIFVSTLESFKLVEALGEKQAIISFASDMIIKDIRRANSISDVEESGRLTLNVADSDYCLEEAEKRTYSLSINDPRTLRLERLCSNKSDIEPLVSGFSDNGFVVDELAPGYWQITLTLSAGSQQDTVETIAFSAMNRSMTLR